MSNTEKAVTWGLLALIAYELYQPAKNLKGGVDVNDDNIPLWVKQFSRNNSSIDFFRRSRGLWGAC